MLSKTLIILTVTVILLLVLGAVAFHLIESPYEKKLQQSALNAHAEFLANFSCVSVEQLEEFVTHYIAHLNQGITVQNNTINSSSKWDFASAFFFSVTVITTIGYGHIAPATGFGRIFCTVYALISIPFTVAMLYGLGEKLTYFCIEFENHHWMPITKRRVERVIKYILILLLLGVLTTMLPAVAFSAIEGWTLWEAFYYCTITLTTIGFGDFVPGRNIETRFPDVYRMFICIWIFLGLAWMSLCLSRITNRVTTQVNAVEGPAITRTCCHKSSATMKEELKTVNENQIPQIECTNCGLKQTVL